MSHLFKLLVISFLLQTIGYFYLKKELKKEEYLTKPIKNGLSAVGWGNAIQLFIIIALLYSYYL